MNPNKKHVVCEKCKYHIDPDKIPMFYTGEGED